MSPYTHPAGIRRLSSLTATVGPNVLVTWTSRAAGSGIRFSLAPLSGLSLTGLRRDMYGSRGRSPSAASPRGFPSSSLYVPLREDRGAPDVYAAADPTQIASPSNSRSTCGCKSQMSYAFGYR